MTRNQIAYWEYVEKKTADRNQEYENQRSHKANEDIQRANLSEAQRHNLITEMETGRHNKAGEGLEGQRNAETVRHNIASEKVARDQVKLGYYQADINKSLGQQNVALGRANLAETSRSNQAREAIQNAQLGETMRHNVNEEKLGVANVAARVYDSTLGNVTKLIGGKSSTGSTSSSKPGGTLTNISGRYVQVNAQ